MLCFCEIFNLFAKDNNEQSQSVLCSLFSEHVGIHHHCSSFILSVLCLFLATPQSMPGLESPIAIPPMRGVNPDDNFKGLTFVGKMDINQPPGEGIRAWCNIYS